MKKEILTLIYCFVRDGTSFFILYKQSFRCFFRQERTFCCTILWIYSTEPQPRLWPAKNLCKSSTWYLKTGRSSKGTLLFIKWVETNSFIVLRWLCLINNCLNVESKKRKIHRLNLKKKYWFYSNTIASS